MLEITITAPDLVAAINYLAEAIASNKQAPADKPTNPTPVVDAQSATTYVPQPTVTDPTAPVVPATTGIPNPAPTAPAPSIPTAYATTPMANPVPTAAPTYTLEMIATAGTALVDAGKMDALCNLLTKYGVDSLTKLDPSQYGVFATELRSLGAQI